MKTTFTILLLLTTNFILAQTIEEDKIDEFTKNSIKRTSWETLTNPSFNGNFASYVRISKINSTFYLNFKMWNNGIFSILKDDNLFFKLKNDSIVTLFANESTISCRGCGSKGMAGSDAFGVKVNFNLDSKDIELLKGSEIEKIRIYTTGGYLEKAVKERFSEVIKKELMLFNEKNGVDQDKLVELIKEAEK